MGPLLSLARRTELVPRLKHTPPTAPRQLDLVFDDVRLRGCQRRREIASAGRSKIASRRDWRFVDWAMRHGRRVCSVARAVKPCNRVAARFWRGA